MKVRLILWLLLLYVPASAQMSNLDFEQWHLDSTGNLKLDSWRHFTNDKEYTKYGSMLATWRDLVAEHGDYALTVSRWYASNYDHVLQIATAPGFIPVFLNGFYIYKDPNLVTSLGAGGIVMKDSAVVSIALTKWNLATQMRDTIGYGRTKLTEVGSYTAFSVPILYSSQLLADSVAVSITPTSYTKGNVPACHDGGSCSYLTIDNLELSTSSIVPSVKLKNTLKLYPVPCYKVLNIESEKAVHITVINDDGMVVTKYVLKKGLNSLDVQQLSKRFYFIVDDTNITSRFLKL